MSEQDPFEARVSRLVNYLTRAHKHNKPSILFALYLSEFLRTDVESSLDKSLKEQGIGIVAVDAGENKDIPAFISSINSKDTVFLVHNLEKGFPEALKFLNFKREELVDNKVKVVFWVTEEELARITLESPDFFAFRNRVVEFMEPLLAEEHRHALVDFAMETDYKSLEEIKHSINLKEKLLDEISGEDEISGYLLGSLGILYYQISSYKKAIEYHEKALAISREISDRHGESIDLGNLGNAYYSLSHTKKAIEYYEKALAISREISDRRSEGNHLGNLGLAYRDLGLVEKAIEYYEKALVISREISDRHGESIDLGNLGNTHIYLGNIEKAIEYFKKALVISKEMGDRRSEGMELGSLGNAYYSLGKRVKAIEYFKKALAISKEMGDRRSESVWLGNLGIVYSLDHVDKGIEYFKKALVISREIGDRRSECHDLGDLGNAYYSLGQREKGIKYFKKALAISREIADRQSEGLLFNNLGFIFEKQNKNKGALACYCLARGIRIEIKDPELKTTESNLENMKEKLGKVKFKNLEAEVAPKAKEIVNKILESKLY